MRHAAFAALLAAGLGATAAAAQHAGGAVGAGDVPAGAARIHGRVVRAAGGDGVGAVEVDLYALPKAGAPGVRRTRSAPDGAFAFERIAGDPDIAYLVGARVGEIPFPGARIAFAPGELDHAVEIRIAEPTQQSAAISVTDATLRLDWTGGHLTVTETYGLENASDRVFFVAAPERERIAPAFRTGLPSSASGLTGPLGVLPDGLVRRDAEVEFFGPVYPGSQNLVFSYTLPVSEAPLALAKRLPSGARSMTVLVPENGPSITAPSLRPGERVTKDGRSYLELRGGALRPGAALALEVRFPPAQSDPSALSVEEVRAFLEQDDAALTVRENHRLAIAGDRPLVAGGSEPLYRIAIPEDARDIRFATDPPGISLLPADDGGIVVAGPLPPGPCEIELLYHVPVENRMSRIVLESSRAVPLLSVFVADTGLDLRSERLHRRRPVRTEDRTYMHLEAFELDPNETVSLEVSSLVRARGAGRKAALAATLLGAAGIAAALVGPLRRARPVRDAAVADEEGSTLGEREALYAAMRDLDEDFETGKVSAADHALLRDELRGRAAALLRAERSAAASAAAHPASGTAARCSQCHAPFRPDDRFCGQCGTARGEAVARAREAHA